MRGTSRFGGSAAAQRRGERNVRTTSSIAIVGCIQTGHVLADGGHESGIAKGYSLSPYAVPVIRLLDTLQQALQFAPAIPRGRERRTTSVGRDLRNDGEEGRKWGGDSVHLGRVNELEGLGEGTGAPSL